MHHVHDKQEKIFADVAQLIERLHGKEEVRGLIPRIGSKTKNRSVICRFFVLECIFERVVSDKNYVRSSKDHVGSFSRMIRLISSRSL